MLKEGIDSDKLLSFLSFIPIHPNHLTLFAVVISAIAFFVFSYDPLIAIILFAVCFFVDALDGVIARAKNLVSKKGAFLDGISDRLVEFFLILTILVYLSNAQIIFLSAITILFFGTCMTAYVKAYSHHQGVLTEKESKKLGGILQRAERVILLFIILILFVYVTQYAIYLLVFTAVLSLITFVQRVFLIILK